jgi:hypothetical protein
MYSISYRIYYSFNAYIYIYLPCQYSIYMNNIKKQSIMISLAVIVLILVLSVYLTNTSFAMGNNPQMCNNRYNARITSIKVDNGVRTFNITSNKEMTFDATLSKGYRVTFSLKPVEISSSGNTHRGTAWYRNTAYGFSLGSCIQDINAGEEKTVILRHVVMGQAANNIVQDVIWGSWPDVVQISYKVHWHS